MLDLAYAAVVEFPLRGEWAPLQTPAERVPSHGTDYLGQRYAYDFVRLAPGTNLPYRGAFWRHLLATVPAEVFLCWDEPVFAAFDGAVVATGDGWPDRHRINLVRELLRPGPPSPRSAGDDLRPLAGNFVLVEGEPGTALYAHLRAGSVCVQPGQRVQTGEPLGTVGNSGNSTQPHLHFHLMDGPDPFAASGLLCAFAGYERHRDGAWQPVERGVPAFMERIRLPC